MLPRNRYGAKLAAGYPGGRASCTAPALIEKVGHRMGKREPIPDSVDDDFEDFSHCFTGECRVNVLPTLYKISQVIASSEDLEHSLEIILNVMSKVITHPHFQRIEKWRGAAADFRVALATDCNL
jgi:hypothetical protein